MQTASWRDERAKNWLSAWRQTERLPDKTVPYGLPGFTGVQDKMDNSYLILKSLHILGAVMFLGNIIVTGW